MQFSLGRNATHKKLVMKGNDGILVCYDGEQDISDNVININNYGIHYTWTVIEANSFEEAIKTFHSSYEEARFGGSKLEDKALQIDRGRRIIRLPYCHLMDTYSGDGRFACGPDGAFGMCALEPVADFPSGECALKKFCRISIYDFSKVLPRGYVRKEIYVDEISYRIADLN